MSVIRLRPREQGVSGGTMDGFALWGGTGPERAPLAGAELSGALQRQIRRMHEAYHAGDTLALGRAARSMVAQFDQVGLSHEARVAADVLRCSEGKDRIALSATLARLSRLADNVLTALAHPADPF